MTPERWQRLKSLFQAAVEMPQHKRSSFVAQACGSDSELGRQLASLVDAHTRETRPDIDPIVRLRELFRFDAPQFSEGEVLLGRFQIVRLLGSGGMGDVYEANDLELGRIALKTIRPDVAGDPQILSRFKTEVQLARRISDRHVCRIYEMFVVPDRLKSQSTVFLTMEFLDGITLAERIQKSGSLPWLEARSLALQLCAGLRAIHGAGVIHRDFKTRNVMLAGQNGSERAVVMDFGLAREVAGPLASTASGVTIPGALVGTPEYMAPEQFENGSLTPATDIYALGVVFYEMLTGERPFAAATPTAAAIRRAKRPPAPSSLQKSVPHFCDRVIDRCLQYDPELRFQSSEELAEAIEHRSFTVSRLKRASGRGRIRRAVVAAANILLVAILVVAGWYWLKDREPSPELRRRSEAQAWYDQALTALRQGAYWKGARALERAVTLDKGFTIAHARLADAWAEQDFTSKAEHEMLVASSPELNRELSPMDRRYVDAIRATLIQDFAAAIDKYREILKDLPQGEKAYGYADLGRAYEKANNVPAALASYRQAASLAPEEPQPFVRLAVLESRKANHDAAATNFKNAEALYNYSSNLEGIAEVDYQRGCAATVEGRLEQAKRYLEASQRVAHQIGSLQLEIRALIRLSTVEYLAGRSQNSTELANTAIRLAQENHLGAPVTDAVIHLGNAYLTGGDYARAEASLRQGLRLAEEGQNPRLVAMAQISLASVLNQQARASELIPLAQAALEYYQRTGFVAEATDASILIVRARRDQAQFEEALRSGLRALELAIKYGNKPSILEAEEAVGSVHLEWEQYPAALAHFHSALAVSREIGQLTEYELLHCADALWRLGRYADAQNMLDAIPANARRSVAISTEMSRIAASMRLSQRRYAEALRIARDALKSQPQMAADSRNQLEIASAMAKAKVGVTTQAVETCRQAVDRARRDLDERSVAEANLALAGVYLAAHQPNEARAAAEAARNFFSRSGQKESEWQTLVCLSKAQSGTHDTGGSRTYALSALAILTSFEHNWGTLTYRMYLSRPDVQRDVREMSEVVRN